MKTEIFKNYDEFLKRKDKDINGVSDGFAKSNPNYEEMNPTNKGCYDCSDCSGCYRCYDCSDCSGRYRCYYCSDKSEANKQVKIPTLENIHGKILEAVSKENALDMSDWHVCDSTHCRAGWVVHLAGEKGYYIEKKSSTLFAAMQIYKESSNIKVSPARFFESNEIAMKDIERCAKLEQKES